MDNKIKVVVVDDSLVFRNFLTNIINQDPRFEVIGTAINTTDARQKIPQLKPDVVTMDIEMPGMSGLDFLKEFLPKYPIPVILVSSLSLRVMDALAVGAIDYVQKPNLSIGSEKEMFPRQLISRLIVASKAKIQLPSATQASASPLADRMLQKSLIRQDMVIAIGASTGGTEATLAILKQFPANMPGIVITQHMPEGFTSMYAQRLNNQCKIEVREAKSGDKIQPGLALLAPGGMQTRVVKMGSGFAVSCTPGEKVSGHRPSVDVLFDSVATNVRDKAIGIILTGMGADGAAGLLRMRKNGAYTIGQDRDTCVVYGMPMEAHKIGAVCAQSPLLNIPQLVYRRLSGK
ncbi:MAG: chemotaxis response regulator protein-glutamate methylesterase [Lachnospiraceae bacterium]|nr:chemotaxis response regulator protein-glutamate methylesterase [Lachnospiraceae bacterium]